VLRSCGAGVDGVGSGVAVARLASDFDFADVGVLRRAGVGGGVGDVEELRVVGFGPARGDTARMASAELTASVLSAVRALGNVGVALVTGVAARAER
jgi:hypothetical protein